MENVLGRVPLIPCYLNGNSVNTIPHCFRGKIPTEAAADSRPDSGTGSRLFEVNMWMWRYGRTFPRQISVEQAVELRKKRVQESRARGAETLRRRHVQAWERGLPLRNKCSWYRQIAPNIVYYIVPNIVYDIYHIIFDIEYQNDLRYRVR